MECHAHRGRLYGTRDVEVRLPHGVMSPDRYAPRLAGDELVRVLLHDRNFDNRIRN